MANSISLWQRIRRTPYQVVAAVFMIFLTLFVMSVFMVLAATSSSVLTYFETKPQLTVFFKDERDKASVDGLVTKLKNTGKLANSVYISKEQALAIYKEQNKNDPLLLEMVTADILPSSLEVSATSPQFLVDLSEIVKSETGVEEVVFQKDVVDTLITWTSVIRKVGILFMLFLFAATFFIILTSIGMKIAFRKEEVEILKLVGATGWYIKKPFIIEGMFYGLCGSTLAWIVVTLSTLYIAPFMTAFFAGIPSLPLFKLANLTIYIWPFTLPLFLLLWLLLLFCGMIIGLVGSLVAVNRYMKY